jgi:hypothetical protein
MQLYHEHKTTRLGKYLYQTQYKWENQVKNIQNFEGEEEEEGAL